ncbi:Fe-S cluster assembly ATPase SufC, partial [candidate division KSB1 bacterium]
EDKEIVKGVSLTINAGEKHAIMGPNGSGKSSLTNALMGHPHYEITQGNIYIDGIDITDFDPDERAHRGLFLGMQYPVAIPGVTVANFLRTAIKALPGGEERAKKMRKELKTHFKQLQIDESFATRYLNDGFSGGEKKRLEILQLAMLKPKVALLDETDSGLDIDALQVVADGINRYCDDKVGVLLVTHYQRMLNYVKPTNVHVFMGGRIVKSGGSELAHELEARGYDWIEKEVFSNTEALI